MRRKKFFRILLFIMVIIVVTASAKLIRDYGKITEERALFQKDIALLISCESTFAISAAAKDLDELFGRNWTLPNFVKMSLFGGYGYPGKVSFDKEPPILLGNGLHDSVSNADLLQPCLNRANKGDLEASVALAHYYEERYKLWDKESDARESLRWREQAAALGDSESAYVAGWRYQNGVFTLKNESVAMEHFSSAALAGHQDAQYLLGKLLLELSEEDGERILRASALRGHCPSASALFEFHRAKQKHVRAYYWGLISEQLTASEVSATKERVSERLSSKDFLSFLDGERATLEKLQVELSFEKKRFFDTIMEMPTRKAPRDLRPVRSTCSDLKSYDPSLILTEIKLTPYQRLEVQKTAAARLAVMEEIASTDIPRDLKQQPLKSASFSKVKFRPLTTESCRHPKRDDKLKADDLFADLSKTVVTVYGGSNGSSRESQILLGSGVAVSNDTVVTNCHVIEKSAVVSVRAGEMYSTASVISADQERDMCVLKSAQSLSQYVESIRGIGDLRIGEAVYAIGTPKGFEKTLTDGLISGVRNIGEMTVIQTTAPISKGSSGGALFDEFGNLIGITTFYLRDSQAINFAIPASSWCEQS